MLVGVVSKNAYLPEEYCPGTFIGGSRGGETPLMHAKVY